MVDEVRVLRLLRSVSDDLDVLRVARAVGSRNVLVHEYVAVDDGVVLRGWTTCPTSRTS